MAEDEEAGTTPKKSDKDKKRTYAIIGIGIVGLIIAYLTLRSLSSKSSATTTNNTGTVTPNSVYGSGTNNPYSTQIATLSAVTTGIAQEVAALVASNTALQKSITTENTQISTLRAKIAAGSGTTNGHGPGSGTGANGQQYNAAIPSAPSGILGKIVATITPTGGGVDYITTEGYVYSEGGANYYGGTSGGAIGGIPGSHIVSAVATKGGGYTEINTQGQTYNFGPGANYAPGGNAYTPKYGAA